MCPGTHMLTSLPRKTRGTPCFIYIAFFEPEVKFIYATLPSKTGGDPGIQVKDVPTFASEDHHIISVACRSDRCEWFGHIRDLKCDIRKVTFIGQGLQVLLT